MCLDRKTAVCKALYHCGVWLTMGYRIKGHKPQDILRKNIEYHGGRMEVDVAIEEMSELTKELIKNRRGKQNVPQIAEEIAHVEIMMEQLKMIFCCRELVAEQMDMTIEEIRDGLCKAGIV